MRGIKLSVKLPLLIVLSVFVSALIIFGLGAYVTRNSLRAVETAANSNSVHAYANAASFYLEEARATLEGTAALPQITDFASAGLVDPALHGVPNEAAMPQRNVAALMLKNSKVFEYVMLLEADGTIYLLEPYELQVKTLSGNLAFRNWYQELMSGGQTVISDLHISDATQRPTVTIATPVRNSAGQVIGIWAGGLKLEEFSKMARCELEAGTPQRYGYITDSRGLIIAHQAKPKYVEEQTDFSSVPPVRAALAGQHGTMQYVSPIDGQEKLGAYTPLPGTEWAVVYVVPTQVAFAPLMRLVYTTLSITVVIAMIATIVSLAIVRQVTQSVHQLVKGTEEIGRGNLEHRIPVSNRTELEQLADAFNTMAGNLRQSMGETARLYQETRAWADELEERVKARTQEVRASEERFRIAAESASDVIWEWNIANGGLQWFGAIDAILGYAPGEFPRTLDAWEGLIHPDDRDRVLRTLDQHLKTGAPYAEEYGVDRKDGSLGYWTDRGVALRDEQGHPYKMIGVCTDITERKRAEEERERLMTELAQKNKELEQLVYVTSHDLRSPLVNVQGFSKELQHAVQDLAALLQSPEVPEHLRQKAAALVENDLQEDLHYILTSIAKMDVLLAGLLKLSRLGRVVLTITTLDLNTLIANVLTTFEFQIEKAGVTLEVTQLPLCKGDATQINQVFSNLIDNALKYRDPARSGVIKISGSQAADQSIYCIADNGIGIAPDHQQQIFEIFHRLNPEHSPGEGLGLTMVRRMLERQGGKVWIESEPGKGSKFYVSLPGV